MILIIAAAALGGTLGSKSYQNHPPSVPIFNHTSPNATAPDTTSPNNFTALNITKSIVNSTALASVAWQDANSVVHYRVYYQDSNNIIKESAWNDAQPKWYVSNEDIGMAKNGTPLAVVSTPNIKSSAPNLHLFFLNLAGEINEWVTRDSISWQNGSIDEHEFAPTGNSQLACYDGNDCNDSVLLVFQDLQNTLQLYKSTTESSTTSPVPAKPIPGSGLGLVIVGQHTYPRQLWLFYQIDSNNLVAADWIDASQAAASSNVHPYLSPHFHANCNLADLPNITAG